MVLSVTPYYFTERFLSPSALPRRRSGGLSFPQCGAQPSAGGAKPAPGIGSARATLEHDQGDTQVVSCQTQRANGLGRCGAGSLLQNPQSSLAQFSIGEGHIDHPVVVHAAQA